MTKSEKATLRKARKAIQRTSRLRKNIRSNGKGLPPPAMIFVNPLATASRSPITPFSHIRTAGWNVSRTGRNLDTCGSLMKSVRLSNNASPMLIVKHDATKRKCINTFIVLLSRQDRSALTGRLWKNTSRFLFLTAAAIILARVLPAPMNSKIKLRVWTVRRVIRKGLFAAPQECDKTSNHMVWAIKCIYFFIFFLLRFFVKLAFKTDTYNIQSWQL